jgi:hypothetical protein
MTQERSEDAYAESYFGGTAEEYDVIKSAGNGGSGSVPPQANYTTEVTAGTFDEWRALWQAARGLRTSGSTADYFKLLGRAPDGVTPTADPVLLDPENLAAYMLLIFYTGNFDAPLSTFIDNASNNWFGVRNRVTDDRGFAFFVHDGEHGMGTDRNDSATPNLGVPDNARSTDRTGPWGGRGRNWKNETMYNSIQLFDRSNPQYLHEDLAFIEEYRVAFGDVVHRHFVAPDATMREEAALDRIRAREATVATCILAESARWGNTGNESVTAWGRERDFLLTWVQEGSNQEIRTAGEGPGRAATIVGFLRQYADGVPMPLYPLTEAPVYSQHGGQIGAGLSLAITDPNPANGEGRTIYFRTDGGDPRLVGGAVSPLALAYTGPVAITSPTVVRSRIYNTTTGEWSALNVASFVIGVPASDDNLVVSEVNYHPADPTAEELEQPFITDDGDFEFLEFMNISPADTVDLSGLRVTSGITYTFPAGASVLPGGRVLVVKNAQAFAVRYAAIDPAPVVLGEFEGGSLNNAGEQVAVLAADGSTVKSFAYSDGGAWPSGADGGGFTLVLFDPASNPDHTLGSNWRSSATPGGNPGSGQEVGYGDWANSSGAGAADADDNGDGFNNLFAYAVGAGPQDDILPFLPTATDEKTPFAFVYYRSTTAVDAVSAIQVTADLVTWAPGGADVFNVEGVETVAPGVERVVLDLRAEAVPAGGRLLGRLHVTGR